MELLGTKFSLTLGSWRLVFALGIEEVREPLAAPPQRIHHVTRTRDYSHVN